jgi:hypothetical protein
VFTLTLCLPDGTTTHVLTSHTGRLERAKTKMRIPQSYVQKCKVVAHIFQAIFIFAALCITIAVFTMDGETGGATKFYVALVGPLSTRTGGEESQTRGSGRSMQHG